MFLSFLYLQDRFKKKHQTPKAQSSTIGARARRAYMIFDDNILLE